MSKSLYRNLFCALSAFIFCGVAVAEGASFSDLGPIKFNRDIRPILSNTCFACHGPDEKVRKGGLQLDEEDAAKAELPSGNTAIVSGDLEASELVKRITSDDPNYQMPPADQQHQLSAEEIRLLQAWIARGAEWEPHWSFLTPKRPKLPQVSDADWSNNPIDTFVLARLEEEGIAPAPRAGKRMLIRRVTLDLTGLPPTPEEVEAFVADDSPDAYKKVVERLLRSPRYGEHMARYWLDLARYADTNGYHIDNERYMWPWRDWVIDAFNQNMPFDQFTIEQLAGDLIPNAAREQLVASGFNRNHMINFEGGAIPEEYQTQYVVDRVNTTGTVWMGLTLGCAQCHDHKFDPISQREFYEMYAFFNSVPEEGLDGREGNAKPMIPVPSRDQQEKLAALETEIEEVESALRRPAPEVDAAQAEWEARIAEEFRGRWRPLGAMTVSSADGVTFTRLDDGSVLAGGENPSRPTYEIQGLPDLTAVTAVQLEVLPHESLPGGSVARPEDGHFVLTGVEAEVVPADGDPIPLSFVEAQADFSHASGNVDQAIDGNAETGWDVEGKQYEAHTAFFILRDALPLADDAVLRIRLRHDSEHRQHAIGRFKVSVTDDTSLLASKFGPWYINGPYKAYDGVEAYNTAYGPESGVDLAETYDDGRYKWVKVRPEFEDSAINPLSGDVAATYLYRTIVAPSDRVMNLSLGSNDAIKVWINGEVIHDNNVQRTAEKNQDRVEIPLKKGENDLLMKVVNYGNDYAFYFRRASEQRGEVPLDTVTIIAKTGERSEEETRRIREYYRSRNWPEWDGLSNKLAGLRKEEKSVRDAVPTTMVMDEMEAPRQTYILVRGEYDRKSDPVDADTPEVMPAIPDDAPANRLGFARWLVSPEHPLTARVTVNRYWQRYFGRGIVKTAEDFGIQGEWPSHPGLLDWLAREFIESGWDVKHMQRLIVTSATYQQDSRMRPILDDRENRLLARGPRFRLDAEMVRDNALAISGLLVEKIGGPSVKPYQPKGIWKEVAYGANFTAQVFEPDSGDALYRRSMYTFWKRQAPPPNMMLFDAPNRETCVSRRARTNTPLQALALMNDPQFVEAARAFAQRVLIEAGPDAKDRLDYAFLLATARTPTEREREILLSILDEQRNEFAEAGEEAKELIAVGDSKPSEKVDPAELAAWSGVTSIILNLDETITKS